MREICTNTIEYNDHNVLSFLVQTGRIDMSSVVVDMQHADIDRIVSELHDRPITQSSDGRWRTYVKDTTKKNNRRLIAKSTLEDLKLELYCHYTGKSKQEVLEPTTMEKLYPIWLDYKRLHTTAETYIMRIESDWRTYYEGTDIVKAPMIALDKLTLDTWAHTLIKKHEPTKKQYYNITMIMKQMMEYAVDLDLIYDNAWKKVKVDKKRMLKPVKKKPSETQVFTRAEISAIENLAWEDFESRLHRIHHLAPLAMMFQFQTGLRACEVCAVRYEDIVDNTIHICRMYRFETKEVVDDTKGTFGDRFVPLTEKSMQLIETARNHQKTLGVSSDGYIFSMTDEPLSYYSLRKIYPRYCEKLEIISRSSHKARKTFISLLLDGGVNLNTAREIVGHNDERTTLNSYHYDTTDARTRINLIENALAI